jgi:hypothetical protein
VVFCVLLRSVLVVLGGMQGMPVRYLRVVRGLLVIAGPGVLCRFAVVLCRMVMVLGRLFVVVMNLVCRRHCLLPVKPALQLEHRPLR